MHPIYDIQYNTLLVVCYEAGAAEVVSSLVKNIHFYKTLLVYTEGPAVNIFEKKLGFSVNTSLDRIKELNKDDAVLTGRSLVPELERDAIYLAKQNGIKTISYLDHWVNFKDFFLPLKYKKQHNPQIINAYLPDNILVGDNYAFKIAKEFFKDNLYLINNEYFNDLKLEVQQNKKNVIEQKYILFISDPLSIDNEQLHNNEKILGFDEFDMIEDIILNSSILQKKGINNLIIRPHPNHNINDFKGIISKITNNDDIKIIIGLDDTLIDQIMQSDIVIGMESMALVVALEFGKKAVSYIPQNSMKKSLNLPHKDIIKINKIQQIGEYL